MATLWTQLAWLLMAAAAGGLLFLAAGSRLLLLRDTRAKRSIIAAALVVLVGGLMAATWVLPPLPRTIVLGLALAFIATGEALRLVMRRLHAGTRPLDTVPHRVRLTRPFTTMDVVTHRYRVHVNGWSGPTLRIVHVSDLHVNPHLPESYFRDVMATAERVGADLAFLTGDFVTEASAIPALRSLVRPLGRLGTYAVLGNHDYWADAAAVRAALRSTGVTVLENESIVLPGERGRIRVTGVDYPWGSGSLAIPPPEEGVLHLVLSHTPDNIYRLSRQVAHCVFSGHLHAGQFRLPLLGPLVAPSWYGRCFDHGHFQVDRTHLFVAGGIGAASPPIRIYCQPDLFVVELAADPTAV